PRAEMRAWRLAGLGESRVEEMVGAELLALGLELGYCARPGEVDLRTIGAPEVLERPRELVVARLRPRSVTADHRQLEQGVTDRETFKFLTTQTALDLLRRRLLGLPTGV